MLIFSDKNPLDIFSSGDEVYKTNGKDLIEDSIRRMTEECDYLQVWFYFLNTIGDRLMNLTCFKTMFANQIVC